MLFVLTPTLNVSGFIGRKNHFNLYGPNFSPIKPRFFFKEKNLRIKTGSLIITSLLGPSGGFFGVGSSEVLVIGVVAWLILGPKRLYQLARDIGRISAEFKNVTEEARVTFQKAVSTEVNEPVEKERNIQSKKPKNSTGSSESRLAELNDIVDSEISNIKQQNK